MYRFITQLWWGSPPLRPTAGRSSYMDERLEASSLIKQGLIVPHLFGRLSLCPIFWQATCPSHYTFFMLAGGQTSMSRSSSTSYRALPTPMIGKSRRSTSSGGSTRRAPVARSPSTLWRMVIYRALEDLARGTPADRIQAARWLMSDDCKSVCYLAGCGIEKLKEVARRLALAERAERIAILRRLRAQAMAG